MKTALHASHLALGAKMVNFSGWEMPLQYQGILVEHRHVREKIGIFDVSHMGRIHVEGNQAEAFLDYIATNTIANKPNFSATYTVMCDPNGMSVDDVIIYKTDANHYFVIVNAGNRDKDLAHLKKYSSAFDVDIIDCYATDGILAIQGPKASALTEQFFPEAKNIQPMHFMTVPYEKGSIILSKTGYTGAGGFEIYAKNAFIVSLWDAFLKKGGAEILPVGLGARDTLRLEMGYALYGHEISETIAPTESIAAWTVKLDKNNFLGKEALINLDKEGKKRFQYGIKILGDGIARSGYSVLKGTQVIGNVTSGTFSPTLNEAIAIVMVSEPLQLGEEISILIRNQERKAKVVKLPFLEKK